MQRLLSGARRLNGNFCEYLGYFAFGATGVAMGVSGAAITGGAGALALLGMYAAHRTRRQDEGHLEDEKVLKGIIDALADDWRADDPVFSRYTEGSALARAQDALTRTLHQCDMSPERLAAAATDETALPFPQRATELVLSDLARLDPAAYGPGSDALPRDFARAVISKAFSAAVTNRAYFERFQPFLLVEIARTSGEGIALQRQALEGLAALSQQMQVGFGEAERAAERRHQEMLAVLRTQRAIDLVPSLLLRALTDRTDGTLQFEDQISNLISQFDAAQELRKTGHSASNLDAFVQAVLKRVADKAEAGDLPGASEEADRAFAQWEREEEERAAASARGGAAILETGINADKARGDANAVAAKEIRLIDLTLPEDARWNAWRGKQDEYDQRGQRFGVRLDLEIAAALSRLCITRAPDAARRAMAQNDLAIVLSVLGTRGQAGALGEAAAAYRAALTVYTQDAAPMDWAMTQNNLGVVLQVLGERGKAGALEAAVDASSAALTVYTQDAAPMAWAMTQNNLGNVLRVLGTRGQDGALEDAVDAYRAALTVYTQDAAPMDWAMTQENLALVLEAMATRDSDPRAHLEAALSAAESALEVYRAARATYNIEKCERLVARLRERLAGL